MEPSLIVSIVGLVVDLLVVLATNYFGFQIKIYDRIARLEEADRMFHAVIDPHLASIIHSPIHVERDKLMDMWSKGETVTREQLDTLSCMLGAAIPGADGNKKLALIWALAGVERQKVLEEPHGSFLHKLSHRSGDGAKSANSC